ALVSHLRARGLSAINLDLIYGLPRQTVDSFVRTIDRVVSLAPTRIALFGYAHVPWVSPHQKALDGFPMPGPEERMEIFGCAFERLVDAGYRHVGMDHFAREDDELIAALRSRTLGRNFMGYTTRRGLDLVALGASGISAVGGTYAQNEKDVDAFTHGAGMRWTRGFLLSAEDCLRREVILDLFCNFHLDVKEVERRFGIDFGTHFARELESLRPLVSDGLVELVDDAVSVTELGRFFVRNVAMVFDQYIRSDGAGPRYSRVI
ncbi:MAG: oxygen-independent coproporphyrinogen III oxidase, partial [Deltaproteobacteria bacterium]|nr:oxygen-independent coproporphyrinogen III oxidase [Deltaproteobacteria bacterium]